MDVVYRPLDPADLNMILKMNQNFREGFVSTEAAETFLSKQDDIFFAAIKDNTVIGFAFGYRLNRLDSGRTMLYIHEVGVMDAWQRQGVGFGMMNALKQWCKGNGVGKIFLTCYQNNTGANKLYRKLGAEVSPESQGNDTVYFFPVQ